MMEPELGAEQSPCCEDSVMRLWLSTPFEPYGRYTTGMSVELNTSVLCGAEGEALRAKVGCAFERETALLLRRIHKAEARKAPTAAERIADAQLARLLGTVPQEDEEDLDDGLGELALAMDTTLSRTAAAVQRRWEHPHTPLAEQWACAVAAAAAAASSGLPGARDEARAEYARAMLVQTAEDFAAVAVRAARAHIAGFVGAETGEVVLETPDPSLSALRYEREAKALKKTFGVLSHALTAALTAAGTAPAHDRTRDEAQVTTVPCAVLVEYCGFTVLATSQCPRGAAPVAATAATAGVRERAVQYMTAARLRNAAKVADGMSVEQWTPSRGDDEGDDDGALPAFCFVRPNWRLLDRLPPPESNFLVEAPLLFVRPELEQCRRAGNPAGVDEMAARLRSFPRVQVLTVFLEELLHMHGVSVRDLNRLQRQLGKGEVGQWWVRRIKVEMIARAFHKVVNEALRRSMSTTGFSDVVARHVVVSHFNALLAMNAEDSSEDGAALWCRIEERCQHMFGVTEPSDLVLLTEEEQQSGVDIGNTYTVLLFRRASELLGVEWCAATAAVLTGDPADFDITCRLTFADIAALHPRVKQMHWVLHAQGLLAQAQRRADEDDDYYDDYEEDCDGELVDCEDDDGDYDEEPMGDEERQQCLGESVVSGVAGMPGEVQLLAALRQEPRCVATLRALGQCYRAQWTAQRQRAQSTLGTRRALECLADMFLVLALQCDLSDARALFDLAVLEDQRGYHQSAQQLCACALRADSKNPAALTLRGDLALIPTFCVDPATARLYHLAAIDAAAKRLAPCPHARINHAVACLRVAADPLPPAKTPGAVCALCEEAGAALLCALSPTESGAVPSAALLWDLAEYARTVLACPDLAAVLRRVLALCHPRSPHARAAAHPVLSGPVSPATPASPAAPAAPAQCPA